MTEPLVPGLFPPPCREMTLNAISRALLRIRSNGVSTKKLMEAIDASADAIASSIAEESLLNFNSIARIGFHFPEEYKMIEALWTCSTPAPVTTADRLDRIDHELTAVRKGLAA